ncbi:hypothetical protein PTKIN_Ptkin06aG0219100 [Pterospermum kingtungense]
MWQTTAKLGTLTETITANPWSLKPHRKNPSRNLSFDLKRVALEASSSVVGILSHLVDDKYVSTIFTSASLLRPEAHIDAVANGIKMNVTLSNEITCEAHIVAYDFHYNIAALKIETEYPIATARVRQVNDSISIDLNMLDEEPSKFLPQSDKFILVPGDIVVALGRNHVQRNGLMIVAGEFSINRTGLDCQELFRAEFEISRVNTSFSYAMALEDHSSIAMEKRLESTFIVLHLHLSINIVSMWWEQFKKNGHCLLPRLGMELSNLHLWSVAYLERVIQRFPNFFEGGVVDEITSESPAHSIALMPADVIMECDGKYVGSVLEVYHIIVVVYFFSHCYQFFELIWDKVGQPVRLAVLRPEDGSRLNVTMIVGNVGPDQFNRWPLPRQRKRALRMAAVHA